MTDNKLQEIKPAKMPKLKDEAEMLISQAIDRNVPVETMEKLLAMRRELKAEKAKELYDRAMAKFQAECPVIVKTKEVRTTSGQIAYRYAPIDSIVSQVKDALRKNGFSYSTNMELLEDGVKVSVRVTHEAGHSEITDMSVPLGTKTNIMSQSQVVAAAQTFAKRYAFCNAFGILTGDEDTDAAPQPQLQHPAPQAQATTTIARLTPKQKNLIFALLPQKGKTKDELDAYILGRFKKESVADLAPHEASLTIEKLMSFPDEQAETLQPGQTKPDDVEVNIDDIPDDLGTKGGEK